MHPMIVTGPGLRGDTVLVFSIDEMMNILSERGASPELVRSDEA